MFIINARNVNDALSTALEYLHFHSEPETSRNGPVFVAPGPVITEYAKPNERVLFSPLRNANPVFHLMEALWMLAGRNDLDFPVQFNKNFASYSDDGKTVHGAYGHRWRHWFGYDQLPIIIRELQTNPQSRRCVLTMWDAHASGNAQHLENVFDYSDLVVAMRGGKDVPCNTQIYFDARHDVLNMTVLCRSNDIWWGCYGANAVHFSILQEFVAAAVGIPIGVYRQFSNNFHLYPAVMPNTNLPDLAKEVLEHNHYALNHPKLLETAPLVNSPYRRWIQDLDTFLKAPEMTYITEQLDPFFAQVAAPMYRSWLQRKRKEGTGMTEALKIVATDWRFACCSWIERRETEKERKAGA